MDEEISEILREHGWFAADINDHEPPYLYIIGLMKTCNHPEFMICGLESDNAHALFSGLIRDIRAGKSYAKPGVHKVNVAGDKHPVEFRKVHPTQHQLYLGFALGFMRSIGRIGKLKVMQAFWPDNAGKFPSRLVGGSVSTPTTIGFGVDAFRNPTVQAGIRINEPETPARVCPCWRFLPQNHCVG